MSTLTFLPRSSFFLPYPNMEYLRESTNYKQLLLSREAESRWRLPSWPAPSSAFITACGPLTLILSTVGCHHEKPPSYPPPPPRHSRALVCHLDEAVGVHDDDGTRVADVDRQALVVIVSHAEEGLCCMQPVPRV